MVERKSVMKDCDNVLYLSFDGLTDPLGQSQVLPYLCGLSRDYSITIVSFEKSNRFHAGRSVVDDICNAHNIRWIPLTYHTTPPIFCTLYDLWRLQRLTKKLHIQQNFKIVHCRSYITSLIGLWIKRKYGVKFIFDMRGFWADERVDGGLWNLKNPLYKSIYTFFKKKEKQFIAEADAVISLTENAKEEILNWKISTDIDVIPCCVDLDLFDPHRIDPSKRELLRNTLGIKYDDFVLLYLGSLGTWYMLSEMLDFFKELKKIKSNSKFLIITHDDVNVDNYEYKQDIIVCHSRRVDIPSFISLATGALVFIKPAFSKKASSATKCAEILAMGVPVLSNTGWGDVDFYEKIIPGFLTISGKEQLREAVHKLIKGADANEIRDKSSHYFSLSHGVELYSDIYARLR